MKYLILGAGPAGLSFANRLFQLGERNFLVLEKEKKAGGLCRSEIVDNSPLDIGGGHFLDICRPKVNEFLFEFMPKNEWNQYRRDSRIDINGYLINHPIEANIWQMKLEDQVEYLKSIAVAGCNQKTEMPEKFIEWIYWKLGDKIADDYMLPYNRKMFGKELNKLGTYWLDKLPDVSFEETLISCLTKKSLGKQPGHTQFLYPKKYGYGELWLRMAETIKDYVKYEKEVIGIDFMQRSVITKEGGKYNADIIINTIPWLEFNELHGMPIDIKALIQELKYTSIQVEYFSEKVDTEAHWIYYPDEKLKHHRSLIRHNFSENSVGYWTETNCEWIKIDSTVGNFKYKNKYAYPLNTINKPDIMKKLLTWCAEKKVYGLGRWGEHQHYNSDITVELAIKKAEYSLKNNGKWS